MFRSARFHLVSVVLLATITGLGFAQTGPGGEPDTVSPAEYASIPYDAAAAPAIDPQTLTTAPPTIGLDHRHQYDAAWNLSSGAQFAGFRAAISAQGYAYTGLDSFNAGDLSGLRAVVLYQPFTYNATAEFTPSEITAIHNFVQNGGGLFVVSDIAGNSTVTSLNQIVAPYGIVYDENSYDGTGRTISQFWYHPVTLGIAKAKLDFQRGMTIAPPALDMTVQNAGDVIIIVSATLATGGDNFLALREGEGAAGNCAFVTDSNMFSDNNTDDAYLGSESNLALLKSIFDFIAKNKPYPCGTAVPALYYRSTFEAQTECWNFVSVAPAFAVPGASRANGAIRLTPSGSASAFGFWTSPTLDVSAFGAYIIFWKVRSTTTRDKCPQFRLRVNDVAGRDSMFRSVESRGAGENSPTTGADTTYVILYNAPPGVTQVTLSFDLLSFDPADNLGAIIELREVNIVPFS